jgi:hypothetical protein
LFVIADKARAGGEDVKRLSVFVRDEELKLEDGKAILKAILTVGGAGEGGT